MPGGLLESSGWGAEWYLISLLALLHVLPQPILAGRKVWGPRWLAKAFWKSVSPCKMFVWVLPLMGNQRLTLLSVAVAVKPVTGSRGEAARCLLRAWGRGGYQSPVSLGLQHTFNLLALR